MPKMQKKKLRVHASKDLPVWAQQMLAFEVSIDASKKRPAISRRFF